MVTKGIENRSSPKTSTKGIENRPLLRTSGYPLYFEACGLLHTSSSDALSDNIRDGQPNLTYDTLRGYFTSSSDALPVNIFDGHLRIDAIQGHDVAHSPGRRETYHSLLEAPSSRVRRGFAIYNNWQSSHGLLTLPQGRVASVAGVSSALLWGVTLVRVSMFIFQFTTV